MSGIVGNGFMGRKKGGGVTPPAPSDILWWYDFADASTIALSGTNVLSVSPRSGDMPDLTGFNNPQYDSVDKSIAFNGTNNYLESILDQNWLPYPQATHCVVIEITTIVNNRYYYGAVKNPQNNDFSGFQTLTAGPRFRHVQQRFFTPPSTSVIQTMAGTISTSNRYLLFTDSDSVNNRFYVNGNLEDTDAANAGWNNLVLTSLGLTLGGIAASTRQFGACKIYETVGYYTKLSDVDKADLFTYLNNKWSIY